MDAMLALTLLFGIPTLSALFIVREARLAGARHSAKPQEERENKQWI
jgi:hypothetical protein